MVLWVSTRLWMDPLLDAWWVLVVWKYVIGPFGHGLYLF